MLTKSYYIMKNLIRTAGVALLMIAGIRDSYSQTTDSTTRKVDVPSETVTIVDSLSVVSSERNNYSNTRTETIRVYSGSHTGNNLVRTIEVPIKNKEE